MKTNFFIPLICFIFICTLPKCSPTVDKNNFFNEIKSCSITGNESPIELKSLIKRKYTIQLEQSALSLLSEFSALTIFNQEIYILDSKLGNIFVFDLHGNFLRNIGQIGKGPGELTSPQDFIIDTLENIVEILDWQEKKIKKYTPGGQYIIDIQLDGFYSNFYKFNNQVYLFSRSIENFTQNFIVDPETDHSKVYGKLGEGLSFFPYRPQIISHGNLRYSRNCFSQFKNGVLFWEIFNDTIYHIIEGSVEKKYLIDFKDKKIPLEILQKPLMERLGILEGTKNKYKGLINDVVGFNDWMIFSYLFNGKNYIYWDLSKDITKAINDEFFQNHCLFKISDYEFVSIGFVDENIELTLFENR